MMPASTINNATWRMAIHTATHGIQRALFRGYFIRKTTQPFTFDSITGVIGLVEKPNDIRGIKFTAFRGIVLLKDGRYCYFEAWQNRTEAEPKWNGRAFAIYARSLETLITELDLEVIEQLKLTKKIM